jgi:hypothetical protein
MFANAEETDREYGEARDATHGTLEDVQEV